MDKTKLRQVIIDQQEQFANTVNLVERDIDLQWYVQGNEIVVITGVRRCGKSSLLKLIAKKIGGINLFLSFDDVRLVDFSIDNFIDVESICVELFGSAVSYFLDEVQNVSHWERWVNNLHGKNKKVFLTGSNAHLLSSEIATYLTGRNKQVRLFPFSFDEYARIKNIKKEGNITSEEKALCSKCFREYLASGGFPLVVKNNDQELSRQYFDDIVTKDILVRHNIRQVKELKDLLVYLFSNTGRQYSYATLKRITGIKSLSTIKKYVDYGKDVFLLFTLGRFDYSLQKQKLASVKPYAGDTSFLTTVSFSFSENTGKLLENAVFLHLIQQGKHVFYHQQKKECDFLVQTRIKITEAIQVCADISDSETKTREIEGLLEALEQYQLNQGVIVTLDHTETIILKNKTIHIIPAWSWFGKTEAYL